MTTKSSSANDIKRDIDEGFASGKFSSPQKTGIAYMLRAEVLFDPKTEKITKTISLSDLSLIALRAISVA